MTDTAPAPAEAPTDTVEPPQLPSESTQVAPDTDTADDVVEGADGDPDKSAQNKEAQRWRQRLRATESERDALVSRLEVLQRGEVERIAADVLADPGDMWLSGATVADMLNDDGNIDPGKVKSAAADLVAKRPHWAPKTPAPKIRRGPLASGATPTGTGSRASWSSVIKGE